MTSVFRHDTGTRASRHGEEARAIRGRDRRDLFAVRRCGGAGLRGVADPGPEASPMAQGAYGARRARSPELIGTPYRVTTTAGTLARPITTSRGTTDRDGHSWRESDPDGAQRACPSRPAGH